MVFSPGWLLHLSIKLLLRTTSLLWFQKKFIGFFFLQFIFSQQEQSNIWTAPGLSWLVDSWLCELVIGWWQWGGTLESDDWWLVLPRLVVAKMYVAILFLCVHMCVWSGNISGHGNPTRRCFWDNTWGNEGCTWVSSHLTWHVCQHASVDTHVCISKP